LLETVCSKRDLSVAGDHETFFGDVRLAGVVMACLGFRK
jgi:hypothetical protein